MQVADLGRSLRLALGTLTAIPVPAVLRVTPATATGAMLLAPVAALPLAVLAGGVVRGGAWVELPPLVTGFLVVGVLALGSRALHLDGLSDVADGLTASYDRARSLEVMKGGTAGPAGVAALVVVLGVQATAVAELAVLGDTPVAVVIGAAVCTSRAALWLVCARPVPAARPDGLGATFTSRVPVLVALLGWVGIAALATLVAPTAGPVTVGVAALLVLVLIGRARARFGGVTGDVFGAAIEVALAVLLVGAAVSV
ncbi:adenosylcobinamide-GDP ribazoletransferase [Nocardioides panacisoli]|uniref:adenosylcobinamide-GDP ribazoletransferase n=1 Tax=Nocardioides panacisoli TaxID=627624 RepID=UPI001C62F1ED|nr:adenosylcobinamide-GDP ribazoletransferase [Nocardioides panacisoli]QYJ05457.1 adenosylcobinamide-GDP ribazoletransferase [Nocardioides panacisoli]